MLKETMTPMERILAAIRLEPYDRVPVDPHINGEFPARLRGRPTTDAYRLDKGAQSIQFMNELFDEVGGGDAFTMTPGGLAFDIGAHAGNRTRALLALGARVVALEPQPDFMRLLRLLFGRRPGLTLLACAAGAAEGEAELALSERTPTVTTLASTWRAAREREPDFAGVRWNRRMTVAVTAEYPYDPKSA